MKTHASSSRFLVGDRVVLGLEEACKYPADAVQYRQMFCNSLKEDFKSAKVGSPMPEIFAVLKLVCFPFFAIHQFALAKFSSSVIRVAANGLRDFAVIFERRRGR